MILLLYDLVTILLISIWDGDPLDLKCNFIASFVVTKVNFYFSLKKGTNWENRKCKTLKNQHWKYQYLRWKEWCTLRLESVHTNTGNKDLESSKGLFFLKNLNDKWKMLLLMHRSTNTIKFKLVYQFILGKLLIFQVGKMYVIGLCTILFHFQK